MFVRARCAAAILAGVALLAGCSGSGSSPRTLPSLDASTGSPSASPSPTSTASELAAASAVVRRYYELLNDLRRSMNADALASLMTATCTCRQQVAAVRAAAAKREHYIDHVTIRSVTPALDGDTTADVLVEYDAGPAGLVDASGQVVTHSDAKRGIRRVIHLQLVGPRWLISEIDSA